MTWNEKHAYYLGLIMGELHNNKRFAMEKEEEEVYNRVIHTIGIIAEREIYKVPPTDWQQRPEEEEDGLH